MAGFTLPVLRSGVLGPPVGREDTTERPGTAGSASGAFEGRDETGSVAVTVHAHGGVVDVGVGASWRRLVGADGFAAALFAAYRAALGAAVDAAANRCPPEPSDDGDSRAPPDLLPEGDDGDFDGWLVEMSRRCADIGPGRRR